jgi:hypothetical protein
MASDQKGKAIKSTLINDAQESVRIFPFMIKTMLTRYTLMTFGQDDFRYWEGYWCLLGLLAYAPQPFEIVMATDHPEYFRWFGDRVRLHAMSSDQVSEWLGPQGYFLRTLIKTLELGTILEPAADIVVYMDTDSVARCSLAPLVEAVQRGQILMDRKEYNLFDAGKRRNKGARKLWRLVGNRHWGDVLIDRATDMWNTGITAIGRNDAALVKQALTACDEMLASGCSHRLTEQIAMSAILTADKRAVEVSPFGAEPLVMHYWGNKEGWNEAIAGHLATIHLRGLSVEGATQFLIDHPINRPPVIGRTRKWHRLLGVEPIRRGTS